VTHADDVVVTGAAHVPGAVLEDALAVLPDAVRARAVRAERVTALALAAAWRALEAAGLGAPAGAPDASRGVVVGTAFGCFLTNAEHQRRVAAGGPAAASPRAFAATVSNAAAGEIGIACRLGGPAVTLTAGRAAGLAALDEAARLVRAGHASALVAGGADAWGPALARWLADAGLGLAGEGAAFLVVERRAAAAARGVRPRAAIVGSWAGFAGRGHHELVAALAPARVIGADDGVATARLGDGLAERAPAALAAALDDLAPGAVALVWETCPSGHAAAVAIRREDEP